MRVKPGKFEVKARGILVPANAPGPRRRPLGRPAICIAAGPGAAASIDQIGGSRKRMVAIRTGLAADRRGACVGVAARLSATIAVAAS
jgi:hypothetical protein